MSNQFSTREEWLVAAVGHLQSQVFGKVGLTIPTDVKVSCSFPSRGGLAKSKRTIGQCWARAASDANVNEVFISPTLDDSVLVLDVLTHELIHAIDDVEHGHGKAFRDMALAVGLTGKMTSTVAGEELTEKLKAIHAELGDFPHSKIDATQRKKQTTRMVKVECDDICCGFKFRASRSAIADMIIFDCPTGCGGTLEVS